MFDSVNRYLFEDFVTDTAHARDGEELFGFLRKGLAQYGYERIVFIVRHDAELPPELSGHVVFHSYPEDWVKYYSENDCAVYDPVMRAGIIRDRPFTWQSLEQTTTYTAKQTRFMRLAEEAGLNNGVGIPIRGAASAIAGVGLASSEQRYATRPHLDMLNALCHQFYTVFKRMNGRPDRPQPHLSPKEREILTWVAAGKTDDEIGLILSISRNTVDTHMRAVFRKLNAVNRVTAVVVGLTNGHISL
ncbi:hypothetical protein AEAC466_18680 [Asticcacaulis sp. AC466]|uniref:LuxR family transcriptional regulator n=1 Tax=Asticcacaulis sp. AC466 TaxID=1282362 RepID=UPI0003C3F5FD|nr:LuxR family transcriptional regulator [Asticcacaulis sp. AC466]ESQ82163.1 hypothetical protein AEAC466_18680 [Asticcacaulis sp. AC466]